MGLFKRASGARVTVTPDVVSPRQTVQATVTADKPMDKVSSATLEWGYTNFYRYRWAGRADAAATEMNDSWFMMGEVGTDAGSEKDTEDWVGVTKVDLPVSDGGEFTGGPSSFTVPSWAPGSSDVLARWSGPPDDRARRSRSRRSRRFHRRHRQGRPSGHRRTAAADRRRRRDRHRHRVAVTRLSRGRNDQRAHHVDPAHRHVRRRALHLLGAPPYFPSTGPQPRHRRWVEIRRHDQAGQGNPAAQRHTGDGAVRRAAARGCAADRPGRALIPGCGSSKPR